MNDITITLNAAWWKLPRRTRNRIMGGKYEKTYRGVPKFKNRVLPYDRARRWDDQINSSKEAIDWEPPIGSYDIIPVADESGSSK